MDHDRAPAPSAAPAPRRDDTTLGQELRGSALLLGLSFSVTAVVVTAAQAVAALLP